MERGERERERKMKNDSRNVTMRDKRGVAEEWVNDEEEEKKKEPWLAIQTCHGIFTVLLVKSPTKTFGNTRAAVWKKNCILWTDTFSSFPCMEKNIHQQKRTAGSTSRSNKQTINSTDKCFLQQQKKRAGFVMTREIERT